MKRARDHLSRNSIMPGLPDEDVYAEVLLPALCTRGPMLSKQEAHDAACHCCCTRRLLAKLACLPACLISDLGPPCVACCATRTVRCSQKPQSGTFCALEVGGMPPAPRGRQALRAARASGQGTGLAPLCCSGYCQHLCRRAGRLGVLPSVCKSVCFLSKKVWVPAVKQLQQREIRECEGGWGPTGSKGEW